MHGFCCGNPALQLEGDEVRSVLPRILGARWENALEGWDQSPGEDRWESMRVLSEHGLGRRHSRSRLGDPVRNHAEGITMVEEEGRRVFGSWVPDACRIVLCFRPLLACCVYCKDVDI